MMTAQWKLDKSATDALARAEARPMRRMLARSTKAGSRQALAAVKAATPVVSGRLRASLGIVPFFDSASGSVGVTIEPRSTFSFTDSAGSRRMTTNRGRGNKSVARAQSRGRSIDRTSPWQYAFGIETGRRPKGRLARRAGGAEMLQTGIRAGYRQFFSQVESDTLRFITTGA